MSEKKDTSTPPEKATPGASNPVASNPPVAHSQPPPPPAPPARPPPKNPGLVTVTVDGHEIAVQPGTNMVEAAAKVGSNIPYFCYHPRLSVAANCRMCMVEVSNSHKLVPACQTPLVEGQVIKTGTQKARDQQRATMEFLLLNHPVDCAICDQAGECKLQDYYQTYDNLPSRLEGGKVMKNKRKVLGPLVVLDQERCIICTRCVRFMEEVPKEPQLGVFGRGSSEVIDIFPGDELTSNYSGNIVDICPVGALLNRDYRFKARSWFLVRHAQHLHRLQPRLQHLGGQHGPGHAPLPPARERRDQQVLDVRPGPALLQGPDQGPRDAGPRGSWRRGARRQPRRGGQGRGGRAEAARQEQGPLRHGQPGGLQRGPDGQPDGGQGRAGRQPRLRERPSRGRGRPLPHDGGQEPQPQGARVDRQGSGPRAGDRGGAGTGPAEGAGQGALGHRRGRPGGRAGPWPTRSPAWSRS